MAMHIHPISERKARLTCGSAEFRFGLRVGEFSVLLSLWGFLWASLVVAVFLVVSGSRFFFFFPASYVLLYTSCILWDVYAFYTAFLILPILKNKK